MRVLFYYWNLFLKQVYFVDSSLMKFCVALKHINKINLSCDLKTLEIPLTCKGMLNFFDSIFHSYLGQAKIKLEAIAFH